MAQHVLLWVHVPQLGNGLFKLLGEVILLSFMLALKRFKLIPSNPSPPHWMVLTLFDSVVWAFLSHANEAFTLAQLHIILGQFSHLLMTSPLEIPAS